MVSDGGLGSPTRPRVPLLDLRGLGLPFSGKGNVAAVFRLCSPSSIVRSSRVTCFGLIFMLSMTMFLPFSSFSSSVSLYRVDRADDNVLAMEHGRIGICTSPRHGASVLLTLRLGLDKAIVSSD
jgi:hypothetical protein